MQDVGTQHFVFPGQGVDDHLCAGNPKSVVVKRPATGLAAVVKNLRGFVIAGTGERDLAEVGLLDQCCKTQNLFTDAYQSVMEHHVLGADLVLFCGKLNQSLLDGLSRILRCLAIQVCPAGGRRG